MERVFTTLEVLDGMLTGSGARLTGIRSYLLTHPSAAHFVDAGEGVLGVRNVPAMVKAAVGAAVEERWSRVLLATECDLTDFRAAFAGLGQRINLLTLPLTSGDPAKTLLECEELFSRRATPNSAPAPEPSLWLPVSKPTHLPAQPPSASTFDMSELTSPHRQFRYVLAGPPVGITDLVEQAEQRGWRPLVDLWTLACADTGAGWVQEAVRFASAIRSPVDGACHTTTTCPPLILRSEPFCGTQLSEVAVRRLWPGPVLVLEAQRIGPMDAGQQIRLEAFLSMCESRSDGGSGRSDRRTELNTAGLSAACVQTCSLAPPTAGELQTGAAEAAVDSRFDRRVGIFSTLPQEILWAANRIPVDVNNLFIGSPDPAALIRLADQSGLPRTVCAWTRGLWGAVMASGIKTVIAVVQGDCSNNAGLAEAVRQLGVRVIPFRFPLAQRFPKEALQYEFRQLAEALGTDMTSVQRVFRRFLPMRRLLSALDKAGMRGQLPGSLVRRLLLTSTDMGGDPNQFTGWLEDALARKERSRAGGPLRLAVFGVPTAMGDLPELLDQMGHCVLWETESDFAMIPPARSLESQYLRYTYAYGIGRRLSRFVPLAAERNVDAVIRYQQAFCHHNVESPLADSVLSRWPCFTLEADVPGAVGPRDRLRLEAFLGEHASIRQRAAVSHKPTSKGHTTMRTNSARTLVALDVGSRFAKVIVRQDGHEVSHMEATVSFLKNYSRMDGGKGQLAAAELLSTLNLAADPQPAIIATGYGRNRVTFGNCLVVPEIQAHAAGALASCTNPEFLLVDVGGQDTKALWLEDGVLRSFVMNDRCAAGSGRYAENMAALLSVPLELLLQHWEDPVELSSTCATFGESEVVGLVAEGVSYPRIFAGVLASVASRTIQLVARLGAPETLPLVLAGGVASSPGLLRLLQQRWPGPVSALESPSWNGARGCLALGSSPQP